MSKSKDRSMLVNCDRAKYDFLRKASELYDQYGYVEFSWHTGRQRTLTQNKALHLWLKMLADTLNAAGLDMRTTLKPEAELPWTMESCKELLWKPIQKAVINKESTTEAERTDYSYVEQVLSYHLQAKLGITPPPWPVKWDKENQRSAA